MAADQDKWVRGGLILKGGLSSLTGVGSYSGVAYTQRWAYIQGWANYTWGWAHFQEWTTSPHTLAYSSKRKWCNCRIESDVYSLGCG